jgi:acetoacetyl-CoA synthetase
MADTPFYTPSAQRIASANLGRFAALAQRDFGAPALSGNPAADFRALWQWSVAERGQFWRAVSAFAGAIVEQDRDGATLVDGERMPGARFFPGARLNFAENLLARRDAHVALVFRNERRTRRTVSYAELHREVGRVAAGLAALGVGPGDRVAGYLPNVPETVIAMLATTSLGAVWTSCSPDFGAQGVLERFGQVKPKVLFAADGYFYNGKTLDSRPTIATVTAQLPTLERVVMVPYVHARSDLTGVARAVHFADFGHEAVLAFYRQPFDAPLFVMYSSGTTGAPKCILHGVGGTLLQHRKEHLLHVDLKPDDRLFFFTTCGWMMWNWLVSGLASGATIVLYDGSPLHPGPEILWQMAAEEDITIFGTSPRYLAALEKAGARPGAGHDLKALHTLLSTGSPLAAEQFDFVARCIKADIPVESISGGTDIISCFCLGSPWLPVYRGEIQGPGLGMAVEVWNEAGQRVVGQRGELVCTRAFPSMPIGFWNDSDGTRYRATYFARFPGVWHHGDYAVETTHGGIVILGRSDAVLNPGGVRIGTAEIYRQVDRIDEVLESLAVGQDWRNDVRVVLFVRLRPGVVLSPELEARIRATIRANTTPRHVPEKIVAVEDIPRTISGKVVELAVRDVIHGRPVRNTDALANPQALDCFRDRSELQN